MADHVSTGGFLFGSGLSPRAVTELVLQDVLEERRRQDEKWGQQDHSNYKWIAILAEEFGESAKEALEHADDPMRIKLRAELVQTAAVAVSWIEAIDRQ